MCAIKVGGLSVAATGEGAKYRSAPHLSSMIGLDDLSSRLAWHFVYFYRFVHVASLFTSNGCQRAIPHEAPGARSQDLGYRSQGPTPPGGLKAVSSGQKTGARRR